MYISELLKLSQAKQEKWLNENIANLYNLVLSGEHICKLIKCSEASIKDMLDRPKEEEIGSFIEKYCPEITIERAAEIEAGSPVTDQEKRDLVKAQATEDSTDGGYGWVRTICSVQCSDGEAFVTFKSVFYGPHYDIEFDGLYQSKEDALEAIKTLSSDEYLFEIPIENQLSMF